VPATAEITTARKNGVLAIPIQAVVVRGVGKDGKVIDPDALQAAEKDKGPAEKGEEKEGDEIVTGAYKTLRTLKDEARVKPEVKEKK